MITIENNLTFNGKELTLNGNTLMSRVEYPNYYRVYTAVIGDGTITANPMSGESGTVIYVGNTPGPDSRFVHYVIYRGDDPGWSYTSLQSFYLGNKDVTLVGKFGPTTPYNLTLHTNGQGRVSADTLTGFEHDEVNLSNTASAGYKFSGYDISGATLYGYDNDKYFFFGDQDVSITANFVVDPDNPLGLPDYTMRLKFKDNITPTSEYGTFTRVTFTPNVWDYYRPATSWYNHLGLNKDLIEVMGANSKNVKNMDNMFLGCSSLSSVSLFDTTNVTSMSNMFGACYSLTGVPLFNTQNVKSMYDMFVDDRKLTGIPTFDTTNVKNLQGFLFGCSSIKSIPTINTSAVSGFAFAFGDMWKLTAIPNFDVRNAKDVYFMFAGDSAVRNGVSSMYSSLSSLGSQITRYDSAFYGCGSATTASAQLALIPVGWK